MFFQHYYPAIITNSAVIRTVYVCNLRIGRPAKDNSLIVVIGRKDYVITQ